MAKLTVAELEQRIKELEAANSRLMSDHARMALTMREAVHNGNRWRKQFWMLMEMMEVYTKHNPNRVDKLDGDPVGQAKMIASIDPEKKRWSIFWDSPADGSEQDTNPPGATGVG